MTIESLADGPAVPFASLLPAETPSGGSIGSAALHSLALIALATLLILVILPAALGAAGIQAVPTV
jgi:hypothetical protein